MIKHLIHAEIRRVVCFAQHGQGAPKAQKAIFETRLKSRRIASKNGTASYTSNPGKFKIPVPVIVKFGTAVLD